MAVALRHENHELVPLEFLFESYEPQYWWWEVLVCAQKLLLTNANIYLYDQLLLQPFVVLILALVSVKLYSSLDPYILDSDDLFAEISDWAIVALVIFTIISQVHQKLGMKIPMSISVILTTTLLAIFGLLSYFCLKTIVTHVSFFQDMAKNMFPKTTEGIKRQVHRLRNRENEMQKDHDGIFDENEQGELELNELDGELSFEI